MGGYIAAHILAVRDVESFQITSNGANITPKVGKSLQKLDAVKNGINAKFDSSVGKNGFLHKTSVEITLREPSDFNFLAYNRYILLLTDPMGNTKVCGTRDFPLTITKQPIASASASGRSGEMLKIYGKQPVELRNLLN